MNSSEKTDLLFTALSAMHGEQQDAEKKAINPAFKGARYADLPSGFQVLRPLLSKHGLCLTQTTHLNGNLLILTTVLGHKSGQWISSEYPVCSYPAKQTELGSALTYSRRYQSFAICMLAADAPDDDGTAADKSAVVINSITEDQQKELTKLVEETASDLAGFLAFMGVSEIASIKSADFSRARTALINKKGKQQ